MPNQYTQLNSEFSIPGAFWSAESPENVYTGTLTSDEKAISFTTAPLYESPIPDRRPLRFFGFKERLDARFDLMHGFTQNGLCTLCRVIQVDDPGLADFKNNKSIHSVKFRASCCIFGTHLKASPEKAITSARYTFSGLNEWLPPAIQESWESAAIVLRVPHKNQEVFSFCLPTDRTEVGLTTYSELASDTDGARRSRSIGLLELRPSSAEDIWYYLDTGARLENLFSLLTGASLGLHTLALGEGDDTGYVVTKRKSHLETFNILDCVRCSSSELAQSVATWLSEPYSFRSVENLFLGVIRKGKLFTETEFLSLAQALEGLHRVTGRPAVVDKAAFKRVRTKILALLEEESLDPSFRKRVCESLSHVNEPTFASRLNELCGRLGDSLLDKMEVNREQFVSAIVSSRNFYTHAGSEARSGKRAPLSGGDLFLLNQKMRALLRGTLLIHLGIPAEKIADLAVRDATKWRLI